MRLASDKSVHGERTRSLRRSRIGRSAPRRILMVRAKGLEPSRVSPEPKSGASANSATPGTRQLHRARKRAATMIPKRRERKPSSERFSCARPLFCYYDATQRERKRIMGIKKVVQAWNSVSSGEARIVIGTAIGGVLGRGGAEHRGRRAAGHAVRVGAERRRADSGVLPWLSRHAVNARAAGIDENRRAPAMAVSTFVAALVAVVASFLFPHRAFTLSAPAADQSSPSGIGRCWARS